MGQILVELKGGVGEVLLSQRKLQIHLPGGSKRELRAGQKVSVQRGT